MTKAEILEIVREAADEVFKAWIELGKREEQRKREEEQKKAAAVKEAAAKLGDEPERYLNRMFTEMGCPEPFPYLERRRIGCTIGGMQK